MAECKAMNRYAVLFSSVLLFLFGGVILLSQGGCRKKAEYGTVTSAFMDAWKGGDYEKAYSYLSDRLKEKISFQEFKGERELIAIVSYSLLAEARNQGVAFVRYYLEASWKAEHTGKDPEIRGVDFLLLRQGGLWKIGALDELLKEKEEKSFKSVRISSVEEHKVHLTFCNAGGTVQEIRELPLADGETLEYTRSAEEDLDMCRDNLKRLSVALESYSLDNGGTYPVRLEQLVPRYAEVLPACPAGGRYLYVRETKLKTWYARCKGKAHNAAGVREDFPAFYQAKGIRDR
jgi:hypothetical protein